MLPRIRTRSKAKNTRNRLLPCGHSFQARQRIETQFQGPQSSAETLCVSLSTLEDKRNDTLQAAAAAQQWRVSDSNFRKVLLSCFCPLVSKVLSAEEDGCSCACLPATPQKQHTVVFKLHVRRRRRRRRKERPELVESDLNISYSAAAAASAAPKGGHGRTPTPIWIVSAVVVLETTGSMTGGQADSQGEMVTS